MCGGGSVGPAARTRMQQHDRRSGPAQSASERAGWRPRLGDGLGATARSRTSPRFYTQMLNAQRLVVRLCVGRCTGLKWTNPPGVPDPSYETRTRPRSSVIPAGPEASTGRASVPGSKGQAVLDQLTGMRSYGCANFHTPGELVSCCLANEENGDG